MTEARSREPGSPAPADLIINVVLVAVFGVALLATTGWPLQTALFPMIVSGTGLLLVLGHLAVPMLGRARRHATVEPASAEPAVTVEPASAEPAVTIEADDADQDAEYVFASAGKRAWGAALAWTGAFFLALYAFGLLITAPLFSLCYLRFSARKSWPLSIAYALVLLIAIYLTFEYLLTIPVPASLWERS
jgi:hypothetical protein